MGELCPRGQRRGHPNKEGQRMTTVTFQEMEGGDWSTEEKRKKDLVIWERDRVGDWGHRLRRN